MLHPTLSWSTWTPRPSFLCSLWQGGIKEGRRKLKGIQAECWCCKILFPCFQRTPKATTIENKQARLTLFSFIEPVARWWSTLVHVRDHRLWRTLARWNSDAFSGCCDSDIFISSANCARTSPRWPTLSPFTLLRYQGLCKAASETPFTLGWRCLWNHPGSPSRERPLPRRRGRWQLRHWYSHQHCRQVKPW